MRRKTSLLLSIAVLVIGGATIWLAKFQPEKEIRNAAEVHSILSAPQSYDGEHIERLASLGPEAISAIGNELMSGYAYPVDLLYAFKEIEDSGAAVPIVDFVLSRKPHDDMGLSFITAEAIRVLAMLRSRASCAPLLGVLQNQSAHPRIRLATSAALICACEGDVEAEAEELIARFYGDRDKYLEQPNDGFALSELLSALLLASESNAVSELVVDAIHSLPSHRMVSEFIESANPETAGYAEALDAVLRGEYVPLENRLAAAEALFTRFGPSVEGLQGEIAALRREVEEDGYPLEILERVRMLERNSEL